MTTERDRHEDRCKTMGSMTKQSSGQKIWIYSIDSNLKLHIHTATNHKLLLELCAEPMQRHHKVRPGVESVKLEVKTLQNARRAKQNYYCDMISIHN